MLRLESHHAVNDVTGAGGDPFGYFTEAGDGLFGTSQDAV